MKEKLQRFMYGRYGLDSFGKFYNYSLFSTDAFGELCTCKTGECIILLCWALLIYTYFRMFSRQTYKRACENQAYLAKTAKVRHFFASQKSIMAQRKTHHIYKCPTCKQKYVYQKAKAVLKSAVRNVTQHLSRRAK